ncbi:LemA family protein [Candidatus Micrarchaeota archaeon]|nr:LemA family protein [Candidatus Micrarchaeota archaeon]
MTVPLGGSLCIGALLLGGAVVVAGVFFYVYNRLVTLKNRVDNAWAQIDVQLKKRNDLVPNLVNTVKGYAKHEKQLFENVTKARAQMMAAGTVESKAKASGGLTDALKSLFAVAENYPDLKASQNFMMLQEELSGIENKIAYARTAYNDSVYHYNNTQEVLPYVVLAGALGHKKRQYFEVSEEEKKAPNVDF